MPHFPQERDIIVRQINNRLGEIQATFYRQRTPITGWETYNAGTRQDAAPIPTSGWKPYALGDAWGGFDTTHWFRATATVPKEMAGQPVVALLDPGWESLCYVNAIPAGGLDGNRNEILLSPSAKGDERFEIVIEASATPNLYDDAHYHRFSSAQIAVRDELAMSFYWDIKVAHDVAAQLPANSQAHMQLQDLVDWAVKLIDLNNVENVEEYHENLRDAQRRFRARLKKFRAGLGTGKITWVGHSHIDTAWLWALRETRRKCSRTFSSVLRYMEQHPDFIYSQGQPQLYEFVKEHYPTIWEGIRERVKEGRWEATGGGWVEQDSNVSGAEALVRQYLYGTRFFQKEFGVRQRVVWLPDAFGFPMTLPQIWRKAGMIAFGTTKINWGQYNQFPYSLFLWRGLDGTEIFSFMPAGSYGASPTPSAAQSHWDQLKQKDLTDEWVTTFGHGDGGGGPTVQMFENVRRMRDIVGMPRSEFGSLEGYVRRVTEDVEFEKLPVYNDELYLELHRACQTTQARTKRNNRKGELLFRDAEFLSSLAMLEGVPYPQEALYEAWKPFLTNQFHDILPGSSVNEVYKDADRDYARILASVSRVRQSALRALNAKVDTGEGSEIGGTPVIVRNTLGWTRADVANLDVQTVNLETNVYCPDGTPVPSQFVRKTDGGTALIFEARDVPPFGHAVYRIVNEPSPTDWGRARVKVSQTRLENQFFLVQLTKTGTIRRLYDKKNKREVLPKGAQANELQLFDDRPFAHDAWDIDFNVDENRWSLDDVVSISVTERGPVRATVRVVKKTGESTLTQDISIYRTIPRIDFVTSVEWYEKRRLLKAAFPVDVLSRTATYEIQYGAIERPTHQSTSHDRAKFEVPAHRWIDLSEADYGVSLLNDCKYGFDTHENVMRISLLRAPVRPDPWADEGHHEFTYSLYPHKGTWREAGTVRRAYELNVPLLAGTADARRGQIPSVWGFVSLDKETVVVDCIKKAEDSDAIVVRLYEAHGARGPVKLTFAQELKSVTECDLMEENDVEVDYAGNVVSFNVKPWEIRTFKVTV